MRAKEFLQQQKPKGMPKTPDIAPKFDPIDSIKKRAADLNNQSKELSSQAKKRKKREQIDSARETYRKRENELVQMNNDNEDGE